MKDIFSELVWINLIINFNYSFKTLRSRIFKFTLLYCCFDFVTSTCAERIVLKFMLRQVLNPWLHYKESYSQPQHLSWNIVDIFIKYNPTCARDHLWIKITWEIKSNFDLSDLMILKNRFTCVQRPPALKDHFLAFNVYTVCIKHYMYKWVWSVFSKKWTFCCRRELVTQKIPMPTMEVDRESGTKLHRNMAM